jgi:cytochrome P450
MPPHNFAAGHLLSLKSVIDQLPSDAHKVYAFGRLSRQFKGKGAYYIDLWPFSAPFLIVTSPSLANQAVQTTEIALEKPEALRVWGRSLTGGTSMFDAHPEQWRELRALFSPGFSTGHLMTLVPTIVDVARVYCETLRDHARRGDLFFLDPTTARYIMDIIGRVAL